MKMYRVLQKFDGDRHKELMLTDDYQKAWDYAQQVLTDIYYDGEEHLSRIAIDEFETKDND